MVFGRELLPDETDFPIWREEFYKRWDQLYERVTEQIKGDSVSKLNTPYCYELINKKVHEFSKKTMDKIQKIKFVTRKSLLRVEGAKVAGAFTGTKILRVSLMLGWVQDLEEVVHEALTQFDEYLSGVRTVLQSMTRVKPGKTIARLSTVVRGFIPPPRTTDVSSDSESADAPEEEEESDSEREPETDDEGAGNTKPPAAAGNFVPPAENSSPAAAGNFMPPAENSSTAAGL
jgi:hypothetical protein